MIVWLNSKFNGIDIVVGIGYYCYMIVYWNVVDGIVYCNNVILGYGIRVVIVYCMDIYNLSFWIIGVGWENIGIFGEFFFDYGNCMCRVVVISGCEGFWEDVGFIDYFFKDFYVFILINKEFFFGFNRW